MSNPQRQSHRQRLLALDLALEALLRIDATRSAVTFWMFTEAGIGCRVRFRYGTDMEFGTFALSVHLALGSKYTAPSGVKVTIGSNDYIEDSLDEGWGSSSFNGTQFNYIYALAEIDAPNCDGSQYTDPAYNFLVPYVTLQTESELTCPSSSYSSGINNQKLVAGEYAQANVAIPYCPLDGGFPVYAYGFYIHGI